MNKIIFLIIASFVIVLLDLSLVVSNFGHLYVSLLVPIVFLVAVYFDFELALIFAFTSGFFFDISSASRSLFMTVFLCSEVLMIELIRKKIVDFVNPIIFIATIFILEIIRFLFSILFFPNRILLSGALSIVAANLAVALLFTFMWWTYSHKKIKRV